MKAFLIGQEKNQEEALNSRFLASSNESDWSAFLPDGTDEINPKDPGNVLASGVCQIQKHLKNLTDYFQVQKRKSCDPQVSLKDKMYFLLRDSSLKIVISSLLRLILMSLKGLVTFCNPSFTELKWKSIVPKDTDIKKKKKRKHNILLLRCHPSVCRTRQCNLSQNDGANTIFLS